MKRLLAVLLSSMILFTGCNVEFTFGDPRDKGNNSSKKSSSEKATNRNNADSSEDKDWIEEEFNERFGRDNNSENNDTDYESDYEGGSGYKGSAYPEGSENKFGNNFSGDGYSGGSGDYFSGSGSGSGGNSYGGSGSGSGYGGSNNKPSTGYDDHEIVEILGDVSGYNIVVVDPRNASTSDLQKANLNIDQLPLMLMVYGFSAEKENMDPIQGETNMRAILDGYVDLTGAQVILLASSESYLEQTEEQVVVDLVSSFYSEEIYGEQRYYAEKAIGDIVTVTQKPYGDMLGLITAARVYCPQI